VWDRTGFKSLITRLLELRAFEHPQKTPLQSIWDVDAYEALKIISLKNAGL